MVVFLRRITTSGSFLAYQLFRFLIEGGKIGENLGGQLLLYPFLHHILNFASDRVAA